MNYLKFILTFVKANALYQFFELHCREGEAVILYLSLQRDKFLLCVWCDTMETQPNRQERSFLMAVSDRSRSFLVWLHRGGH